MKKYERILFVEPAGVMATACLLAEISAAPKRHRHKPVDVS
jgi:hypothetical protein